MDVLPCGHVARAGSGRFCVHLVGVEEVGRHYRVLRGQRLESDFVCGRCEGQMAGGGTPDLVVVCEGCVERVASEISEMAGWRGSPGVEERPERVRPWFLDVLRGPDVGSPRAVAAFDQGWITVSLDGGVRAHAEGRDELVGDVDGVEEPPREPPRRRVQPTVAVHASRDGRFVAVVNDYGSTGVVVDVSNGATTFGLDRGSYHCDQTPFPVAFVTTHDGGTVLIAATGWNRVDAFDPATGRMLTPRQVAPHGPGRERPAHSLDYFHGALHASPDGRWVLDDGWVWSPVGIPRAWSLERWLGANVWESEDGPSVARFGQRAYLWDVPMCWIDDRLVAIWGLGADDEAMLDGATIYDVEDAVMLTEFAGVPKGPMWSDGRRLFVTGDDGLSVWDPYTGHRTAHIPDFAPIAYNRWLDQFLVEEPGGLRRAHLEPHHGRR